VAVNSLTLLACSIVETSWLIPYLTSELAQKSSRGPTEDSPRNDFQSDFI
jgi:hypothetical protein